MLTELLVYEDGEWLAVLILLVFVCCGCMFVVEICFLLIYVCYRYVFVVDVC
jgi:hypothetical protein